MFGISISVYPRGIHVAQISPKLWIKRRAFGEVHCAQIGLKEEHLVRFIA